MGFTWTIVAMVVAMAIAWRFLGAYMVSVYENRTRWLSFLERPIYRVIGVDPETEQSWQRYGASVIVFSGVVLAVGSNASGEGIAFRAGPAMPRGTRPVSRMRLIV